MGGSGSKPVQQESLPNPELDKPWRKFDWSKKEALQEKLENFSFCNPDVNDIKILVAGQIGAGKSSFINSLNSAFQGRISSRALVSGSLDADSHSFTQKLTAFTIKGQKKPLPFIFKDIMGLEAKLLDGSQPDDIVNAVFGYVKDGYKFDEKQPLSVKDQHFTCDPEISDQSFCLVYVIAADTIQFADDKLIDKLRIIRQRISDRGIPQVVVMTKVDEICPLVKNDIRKVYTSKKIKEKIDLCHLKTGVPLTNIFPVKNYHDEIETEDDIDVLILKALEHIVQIADDRIDDNKMY